jgi:hypothetical protein
MTINSQDRAANLQIVPKEVNLDRSIRCSVKFTSHGFNGNHRMVWFSREALERFAAELRNLEEERSGVVTLTAMSPEDFSLSLKVEDSAGHTYCTVSLSRRVPDFGRWLTLRVSGEFATDPSALAPTYRAVVSALLGYESRHGSK